MQSLAELVSLAERAGVLEIVGYPTDELSSPATGTALALSHGTIRSCVADNTTEKKAGAWMEQSSLAAQWSDQRRIRILRNRNVVLVVDDDPGMLKGIKRLLREHGYDSILFASAEDLQSYPDFTRPVV